MSEGINTAIYLLTKQFEGYTSAGWILQKIEIITGSRVVGYLATSDGDVQHEMKVTRPIVYQEPRDV